MTIHYLTFDVDLGVKVTKNVAKCHLHHVTYAHASFKAAITNGLGKDAFTRNILFDLDVKVTGTLHYVNYSP